MKLSFEWPMRAMSGTRDLTTYARVNKGYLCYAREWVDREDTTQNHHLGEISKNLASVWNQSTQEYQDDWTVYAEKYHVEKQTKRQFAPSGYGIWIDVMYAWQKSDPTHIDLTAVTIGDILSIDADIRTVERSIGAGFIVRVSDYTTLNHNIKTL